MWCDHVHNCCGHGIWQYLLELEEQVRQRKAREAAERRRDLEEDARLEAEVTKYNYFRFAGLRVWLMCA